MTAIAQHPHRVTRAVAGARDQLSSVAEVPLWSMDAVETAATLGEVQAAKAQLAALEAKLLTHAETLDLPGQTGATSTANWLAHQARTTRLDTGQAISPSLARRLVCEAGIIPAVLDGDSQVLDLGRKRRFHSQAQRIAATINQAGTCPVEGCDATVGHAHLHHPVAWSAGGGTNRDGMLICPPHHTRIHDARYRYTRLPTGRIRFHRRT